MRILQIDVCDYTNTIVCPIYRSDTKTSGQAENVFISFERNGWKEISFDLPSKCDTEHGQEDNYRLNYIIADYRLRVVENDKVDWYLITEDAINHETKKKKNVSVTAGHICKLLKNKSLDLEFSDEEGNNVGTAKALATTVLEGTDWKVGNVATFYEDDGKTEKIRSLVASAGTGAFRMIEQIAELFESKPVYNGDKTVDFLPMNPFSELEPGEIPEAVYPDAKDDKRFLTESNVIELHYDKNVKRIERRRNTDNISTRLYGYGAYGDNTSRYCSIQTATHEEYTYILSEKYPEKTEFQISDGDVVRYFTAANPGVTLVWSMLDYTSRRYVWDVDKRVAYHIYEDARSQDYVVLYGSADTVTNYFPFLSDYTYYEKVGLLTEDMFQKVAAYQRDMARYYQTVIEAQNTINTTTQQLSNVGVPKSGYLKLDIESCTPATNGSMLTIRWSDEYPDGVIYRSDYLEAEKNYFQWHVAQKLKENGDPVTGPASIIYVLHNTSPVIQWECSYLKDIDGRTHYDEEGTLIHDGYDYALSDGDRPRRIQLWNNINVDYGDEVFLFCRNSFSGKLGPKFSDDEAAATTLENNTTLVTENHPTIFIDHDEELPEITFKSYGWCYQYNSTNYDTVGTLYFCWAARGETRWREVQLTENPPEVVNGEYYYSTKYHLLFHGEGGEWVKLDSVEEQQVAKEFGVAFRYCRKRDQLYKGLYEQYLYTTEEELPVANYCFPSGFGYYWLFSTDQEIPAEDTLILDTTQGYVYQDEDIEHIVTAKCYPYDTLTYNTENDLSEALFFDGSVYIDNEEQNGNDLVSDDYYRSNYISIWPDETYSYSLPKGSFAVLYGNSRNYLGAVTNLGGTGTFSTAVNVNYSEEVDPDGYAQYRQARYLRLVVPRGDMTASEVSDKYYIQLQDYESYCFTNDKKYRILQPVTHEEDAEPVGINYLIKRFRELSNTLYGNAVPTLRMAQGEIISENQKQVDTLGDILREGRWQDASYVEGDEQRMYNDALTNLRTIAQPEVSYTVDFLDLYGSNPEAEYAADTNQEVEWPDIKITDAVHLVDPEIGVNQWAYIDKLKKCYDKPWETSMEINTQLTLMGQKEFKDVVSRIAEVASETKAKQTVYNRASVISTNGTVSAESLDGSLDAGTVTLYGAGWQTDSNGSMIMEASDGQTAMMFGGSGLYCASSKKDGSWQWNLVCNGYGVDADSITSGSISGVNITTDTVTADKLSAGVGNEMEISSNKALSLYATSDGKKPAGALKTNDAVIEISAGDEDSPAAINIRSGGTFTVESGNFEVKENGDVVFKGYVDVTGGKVRLFKDVKVGEETVNLPNVIVDNGGIKVGRVIDDLSSTPQYNFYVDSNGKGHATGFEITDGEMTVKDLTATRTFIHNASQEETRNVQSVEHRDEFDQINPVSFQYNNSNDTHYGFVYEELQEQYPEICHEDKNGNKGVSYMDMIAVLVKEVQDLRKRVDELERK